MLYTLLLIFFYFKIDSSLHLKIFTPEDYTYEGVILWSTENIDDEKFEEAASIVSYRVRYSKRLYGIKKIYNGRPVGGWLPK